MKISLNRLDTGYWRAGMVGAVHCFAQFQLFPCTPEDVSHNGLSAIDMHAFVKAVNACGARRLK